MTITQLGHLLSVVITQLATLISPIATILKLVGITAKEHTPYHIEGVTNTIADTVTDASFGNAALHTDLLALLTAVAALGAPQQAFSPVTLPSTAPAGFFSNSSLEIADACWIQPPTGYPSGFDAPVLQVIQSVGYMNYFTVPIGFGIFNLGSVNYAFKQMFVPTYTLPTFDPTNILPGETLLANLTRQNPLWIVDYGYPPQTQVTLSPTDGSHISWITSIDESDWPRYYDAIYPVGTLNQPPVWPGLDLVTLGTPVAIADTFTITAPMDGVLVAITGVPSKQGQFNFGSTVSWRNVGAIAFTDDNGDQEFPQTLGFEQAVYCPKSMATSSGLVGRASPGVTGTVTPWTIS